MRKLRFVRLGLPAALALAFGATLAGAGPASAGGYPGGPVAPLATSCHISHNSIQWYWAACTTDTEIHFRALLTCPGGNQVSDAFVDLVNGSAFSGGVWCGRNVAPTSANVDVRM